MTAYLIRRIFQALFVMLAMLLVSLWTLYQQPDIRNRWFGGLYSIILMLLPLLAILAARLLFRDLGRVQRQFAAEKEINLRHESRPFWLAASLFLLAFAGLVVGLFPYLLPRQLSFYSAAAPDHAQQGIHQLPAQTDR